MPRNTAEKEKNKYMIEIHKSRDDGILSIETEKTEYCGTKKAYLKLAKDEYKNGAEIEVWELILRYKQ
jgi:hypothetical protein